MFEKPQIWRRVRSFPWRWLALGTTVVGLLQFFYKSLDPLARGHWPDWARVFMEEMTGAWSGLVILPLIAWLTLAYPLTGGRWKRLWPLYLGAAVAAGFLDTTVNYGLRLAAYAAMGRGWYDYGVMRVRYFMELPAQLIWVATAVVLVTYAEQRRLSREREQRIQALERQLTQAQLETLQVQLHPHFLFNSLNAISTILYEDPRAADRMIASLSDFLRRVLRTDKALEVPLCEELELLDLYLCVMRARFEDKLECTVSADPGLEQALVPQLILQPLVENALRYAADPQTGQIAVTVCARRNGETVLLEITDRGPGDAAQESGTGTGLKNLAARLDRLYAGAAFLDVRHIAGEGTGVRIEIPYRCQPAALAV